MRHASSKLHTMIALRYCRIETTMSSKGVLEDCFFCRASRHFKFTKFTFSSRSLLEQGKMYTVLPRCLDDYYWMLASVSNQTNARQLVDLRVSTDDKDGRSPGLRPILVTNDKMRDHKLDLLEPREFRRWCSCHIVNYNISSYIEDEWEDIPVQFLPADFFSREIQGNTHGNGKGKIWHFPVTEWDEPARFCIWIDR